MLTSESFSETPNNLQDDILERHSFRSPLDHETIATRPAASDATAHGDGDGEKMEDESRQNLRNFNLLLATTLPSLQHCFSQQ